MSHKYVTHSTFNGGADIYTGADPHTSLEDAKRSCMNLIKYVPEIDCVWIVDEKGNMIWEYTP